jgi:DNA recombination protein RmuC
MLTPLLVVIVVINLAIVIVLAVVLRRVSQIGNGNALEQLAPRLQALEIGLSQKFISATGELSGRLEQTKGDLRQEVADRLNRGFQEIHGGVEQQLQQGRREQSESLTRTASALEAKLDQLSSRQSQALSEGRTELATVLAATTSQLKQEFEGLRHKTEQSLEGIRSQVDQKLIAISEQVQQKLNENIREGFAQFEKVQQHLKAAEEQLRQVGVLGESINDLNSLLKLPHLRGKFGEASLERLLSDFLPAHMYELQASPADDRTRADAMIQFPDRRLAIDAKFPREQILALFESSDPAEIAKARIELVRVLKTEAKRVAAYIQPDNGTMDIALMYLPSETLYLEAIRSVEASDALAKLRVFPVSPNTLLMTIKTVALAYRWYEVAARFEETRVEIARAQKSLDHFQAQFDNIGKGLEKAADAYEVAAKHLKSYRGRVATLTGEEGSQLELPAAGEALANGKGAGK